MYPSRPFRELDSAGEETDNLSMMSGGSRSSKPGRNYCAYNSTVMTPRKSYYPTLKSNIGSLHQTEQIEKPNVSQ